MYNKWIGIGNLTRDIELRHTPAGAPVCDLGMAINRTYYVGSGKDGEKKEKKEETVFVDVTVWGRQAETCAEYLEKGRKVLVDGRLTLDTWDDKETGQKRSKLKITAENVQFLPSGNGGGEGNSKPAAAAATAPSGDDPTPGDDEVPF